MGGNRERTQLEAWIWMIMEARFDILATRQLIGGKLLNWGRGQFPGSVRFLSVAWNWKSKGKVQRFLDKLIKDGMITIEIVKGQQIITLTNYENYNSIKHSTVKDSKKPAKKRNAKRDSENHIKSEVGKGFDHNDISDNGTQNGTRTGRGRDKTNNR